MGTRPTPVPAGKNGRTPRARPDPFRAITEKAEEASSPVHDDLPGACSYAWQAVMRVNGQNAANLPTVQGIAVTVAVVDAQRQQVRRAGIGGIRQVVVGTPLFVEQM
ncbi:hypothetical protein [Streptomyces sp. NPDC029526]|uniref:hypothetical protein n=1 Tax=Streptomyces sp. NPDC029526 TaxID=3155728 RepID=UPI0033CD21BA